MCQNKKVNLWKPIELLVQVSVLSIGGYLAKSILSHEVPDLLGIFRVMLPANYCTRPIWNWIEKHEWSIELK